jgi:metal-sulfur cluster biosynthetic enzyme
MAECEKLRAAILDTLSTVIDPETGVNVVRMPLIEDLRVEAGGWRATHFVLPLPYARWRFHWR